MQIFIFEIKSGGVDAELDTDIDSHIMNLYKKYGSRISIQKIDIMNKEAMAPHKDIRKHIEKHGIDALPLIKIDKKMLSQEEFIPEIEKRL